MTPIDNREPAALRASVVKVNPKSDELPQNRFRGFASAGALPVTSISYRCPGYGSGDGHHHILVRRNRPIGVDVSK